MTSAHFTFRKLFNFSAVLILTQALGLVGCGPVNTDDLEFGDTSIIDGTPVRERNSAAARSVVLVEMLRQDRSTYGYCTGTLIDKNIVLTAAHCFDINRSPDVRGFNIVFANSLAAKNNQNTRKGVSYSLNSRYNSQKIYDHDLAVLYFRGDTPAEFSPVAIDTNTKSDYSSHVVYVYGYGHTSDEGRDRVGGAPLKGALHKGIMTIDNTYSRYGDRYLTTMASPTFLCQGDSGGPQFHHEKGVLKQIGINSASLAVRRLPNGKFSCYAQGQATKVAPFAKWIQKEALAMRQKYRVF